MPQDVPLDIPTAVAAGVLATGLGIVAHESAHALAGVLSGGDLVYLSSTGVEGRWSTLRNAGWFFLATSGSAAQGVLALLGWLVFRGASRRVAAGASDGVHTVALIAWVTFVINAWMPAMYLIASPAFGIGDWMYLLDRFAALGPMRVSASVTGLFVVGQLWKATGETLARLVGGGKAPERTSRAVRLSVAACLGSGLIAAAAGALAPIGLASGLGIALGSTVGSTWPVMLAHRKVGERPVPGPPLSVPRSSALLGMTLVLSVLFVSLLGPGIRFD